MSSNLQFSGVADRGAQGDDVLKEVAAASECLAVELLRQPENGSLRMPGFMVVLQQGNLQNLGVAREGLPWEVTVA